MTGKALPSQWERLAGELLVLPESVEHRARADAYIECAEELRELARHLRALGEAAAEDGDVAAARVYQFCAWRVGGDDP